MERTLKLLFRVQGLGVQLRNMDKLMDNTMADEMETGAYIAVVFLTWVIRNCWNGKEDGSYCIIEKKP